METLSIISPLHAYIGNTITFLLCFAVAALFIATFAFPLIKLLREWFSVPDDQVPLFPEKDGLSSLPLGAPRDGGNYIYTGHGWQRLTDDETEQVRENLKFAARSRVRTQPDGWEILAPETQPVHSDMVMEIMNDATGDFGPDDVEEEEIERPDEMVA